MDDSDCESAKKMDKTAFTSPASSAVTRIHADGFRLETADDTNLRGGRVNDLVCNKDLNHLSDVRRAIHVHSDVDSNKNENAVFEANEWVVVAKFAASSDFMDVNCEHARSSTPPFVAPFSVSMTETVSSDDNDDDIAAVECIPVTARPNQTAKCAKNVSFTKPLIEPNVQTSHKTPEQALASSLPRSTSITSLNASANLFDSLSSASVQHSIQDTIPSGSPGFKPDLFKCLPVSVTTPSGATISTMVQHSAATDSEDDSFYRGDVFAEATTSKDRILSSSPDNRQNEGECSGPKGSRPLNCRLNIILISVLVLFWAIILKCPETTKGTVSHDLYTGVCCNVIPLTMATINLRFIICVLPLTLIYFFCFQNRV